MSETTTAGVREIGPNKLWAEIVLWAGTKHGGALNTLPGLWISRAERLNDLGPFDVKVNAHDTEVDLIPPFGAFVGNEGYFPGVVCVAVPSGGSMIVSDVPGEDENGLIEFFKAHRSAIEVATLNLEDKAP